MPDELGLGRAFRAIGCLILALIVGAAILGAALGRYWICQLD